MSPVSPYDGLLPSQWSERTAELVAAYPLSAQEIVEVVLSCWSAIFESRIGPKGFVIGRDIFPSPQIMGALLHELIPLELETRYPGDWRKDRTGEDKDLVYLADDFFSTEVKTSSDRRGFYGNRSYAQAASKSRKATAGFYLVVNFQGFRATPDQPQIRLIRLGWVDFSDWIGQQSPTGQQAYVAREARQLKFVQLFPLK